MTQPDREKLAWVDITPPRLLNSNPGSIWRLDPLGAILSRMHKLYPNQWVLDWPLADQPPRTLLRLKGSDPQTVARAQDLSEKHIRAQLEGLCRLLRPRKE